MLEAEISEASVAVPADDDAASDQVESSKANPEDFPVKYVASAPGDGFAQLALVSDNKLVETCEFCSFKKEPYSA